MKRYFLLFLLYFIACDLFSQTKWSSIEINSAFNISIPSTIELRHKKDAYTNSISNKCNDSIIIFQQKNLSNMSEEGYSRYCRIIITYSKDNLNDYLNADESPALTQDDYKTFNEETQFEAKDVKLINIQSVKWEKIGDIYALAYSYRRTGTYKTPIQVRIYYLSNNNELAKILMSYRESEAGIWKADFEKIINSFRWNNPHLTVDINNSSSENVDGISNNEISSSMIFYFIVFFIVVLICYLLIYLSKNNESLPFEDEGEIKETTSSNVNTSLLPFIPVTDSKTINQGIITAIHEVFEKDPPPLTIIMVKQKKEIKRDSVPESTVKPIKNLYVGYSVPKEFVQNNSLRYAIAKFPKNGCIVWPHRKRRIARRGLMEKVFQKELGKYFDKHYSILGDACLFLQNGCRAYEPDIAIVGKDSKLNIRIDIEIDEPYSGFSRVPIHYIDYGDDVRDMYINNVGWIVIRFSEKQIVEQLYKCVGYIAKIIHAIDPNSILEPNLLLIDNPDEQERWSLLDAQKWEKQKERENYLKLESFGETKTEDYKSNDLVLNEKEQKCIKEVKPLIFNCIAENTKLTLFNSSNRSIRDEYIRFYPEKHLYIYKGKIRMTPVSNLVERFFPSFDSLYNASCKELKTGIPASEFIDSWNYKGTLSREIGTYLHSQIENYFLDKKPVENMFHFEFTGIHKKIQEDVSINKEWNYFENFIKAKDVKPYRTEWRIFDEENNVAGTIDLLCKEGDSYIIYDWKRSSKIINESILNDITIQVNPYQNGIGELSHLDDSAYNHYILQQNIYRYILKKCYNINVDKMYLVILHANYHQYHCMEVPVMDKEVNYILQNN